MIRIRLEPLRKRKEDLCDLARFFIFQLAGPEASLSTAALEALTVYDWPGNIRQLKNCIERAVLSAKRRGSLIIEPGDIAIDPEEESLLTSFADSNTHTHPPQELQDLTIEHYRKFLFDSERRYLKTALELCRGNVEVAAAKLGLGRSTVFKKIKELGLSRSSEVA